MQICERKILEGWGSKRYHLWVNESELQTGRGWESILLNYHSKLFINIFPFMSTLVVCWRQGTELAS